MNPISAPTSGLDGRLTDDQLDARSAAKFSQNVIYVDGIIQTTKGFADLDMTSSLTGKPILSLFRFTELDNTQHRMAVTRTKIYKHNANTSSWDDLTQSGKALAGNLDTKISQVAVAHDDTDIYIDDDVTKSNAYYHLIVSDGGGSDIQRWAGKYEDTFHDLVGGGGYHDGTTQRALQVSQFQTRLILLNNQEYDGSSKQWIQNNQRVRWPDVAKLQQWNTDYSGFYDLIDTGGINVWSAPLGLSYYIYQNNSIWDLRFVGGKAVFDPKPVIQEVGLLGAGLLVTVGNVAYFVGDDFNVYAYMGGSVKQTVGDKIQKYLIDELSGQYAGRGCMVLDAKKLRVWIFIVPSGKTYITKGYGMDLKTGSWMIRDFGGRYDGTTDGITAASLFGAGSYTSGQTYAQALLETSPYDISNAGDATVRYGDELLDSSRSLSVDATEASWCSGGFLFYSACADVTYKADMTVGDILMVADGSKWTNCRSGTHFYSICAVGDHTVWLVSPDPSTGITLVATDTPADVSFTVWNPAGPTYAQQMATVLTEEQMVLGDSSGWVYQCATASTVEQATYQSSMHYTPVTDMGEIEKSKRWAGMIVVARQATGSNGGLIVGYRTANFDTSETGWANFTKVDLTSSWKDYRFPINIQSHKIQWRFKNNAAGSDFEIQSYRHLDPVFVVDR